MFTLLYKLFSTKLAGGNYEAQNVSTRKSNPVRVGVNVHRAAGRTFYTHVRMHAITNAHGRIHCCAATVQCDEGGRQFSTEQSIVLAV